MARTIELDLTEHDRLKRLESIAARLSSGATCAEIAGSFGVSRQAIQYLSKKLGIRPKEIRSQAREASRQTKKAASQRARSAARERKHTHWLRTVRDELEAGGTICSASRIIGHAHSSHVANFVRERAPHLMAISKRNCADIARAKLTKWRAKKAKA